MFGYRYLFLFFFMVLCFFSSSAVVYWFFAGSWLEQQRVFELLMILCALFSFLCLGHVRVDSGVCKLWAGIFLIGAISSVFSRYPVWAGYEWSKSVGLFFLVLIGGRVFAEEKFRIAVLAIIVLLSLFLAYQFFLFYVMAFMSGVLDLNPYLLYPGFDNPRFYSQVLIVLLPLVIYVAALLAEKGRPLVASIVFLVCVIQWGLLIALAGRGSWLAVALASVVGFLLFSPFYRFFLLHLFTVIGGFFLYLFLFWLVPWYLELSQDFPTALRSGLSARELIWSKALEMAFANPFLGVGPMHFSAEWNHIAAHPHQMVLQWAAEWGIPATIIGVFLISLGMWRGFQYIRTSTSATELDVAIWMSLCSALVLAQVDGVFVMPFTEGWLAIVAGMALARWSNSQPLSGAHVVALKMIAIPASLVVCYLLFVEAPQVYQKQIRFFEVEKIGSPPRFWDQGWIPM